MATDPGCQFDPAEWDFFEPTIEGPVLICLTHGMPADGPVYDQLDATQPITGVCYNPYTGHRADYEPIANRTSKTKET